MIQITKKEAEILRAKMPDVSIHRTVHRYYVEETWKVLYTIGRIPAMNGGKFEHRKA